MLFSTKNHYPKIVREFVSNRKLVFVAQNAQLIIDINSCDCTHTNKLPNYYEYVCQYYGQSKLLVL